MAKLLVQTGYGQLEPNHLSAQRTAQIYAQLPAAEGINQLQNAQFAKYDYATSTVNFTGEGEWMLVYNEVKLYDPKHSYKDFVFDVKDFTDGKLFPRVFKTNVGDIFTTNLVKITSEHADLKGKKFSPNAEGILEEGFAGDMQWVCAKAYTMADGQPAVKLQRIA